MQKKKQKDWAETIERGLQVKDSDRTSVRKIMSRLRGQTEADDGKASFAQTLATEAQLEFKSDDSPKSAQETSSVSISAPLPVQTLDRFNFYTGQGVISEQQRELNAGSAFEPALSSHPSHEKAVAVIEEQDNVDTGANITPVKTAPVSKITPVQFLHQPKDTQKSAKTGFLRIPNSIIDEWIPKLTPVEAVVFLRLYRLSIGFNKTECLVGTATLAKTCNISENTCRTALRRLIDLEMIRSVEIINSKDIKGTLYEVRTLEQAAERLGKGDTRDRRKNYTGAKTEPNKRHDHDDQKNMDHHQKDARAREDDDDGTSESAHLADVRALYCKLTGNAWKSSDADAYAEVADVAAEEIVAAMRRVADRTPARPNSFRYFLREIKAGMETGVAERDVLKLLEVAKEVRSLNTGRYGYTDADFREDVKVAAARRGAAYGPSLLEEALRRLVEGQSSSKG